MKTHSMTIAKHFALAALMVAGGALPAFGAEDVAEAGAGLTLAGTKAASATSTISLAASVSFGVAPAQVTLVATIGGTALKGDIAFKAGTVTLAVAAINKTTATVTVKLPAAIHSLTAVYAAPGGDLVSPPTIVVVDNALACS